MLDKRALLTLLGIILIIISFGLLGVFFTPTKAQLLSPINSYPFEVDRQANTSISPQLEHLRPLPIEGIAIDTENFYYTQTLAATEEELKTDDGTVESGVVVDNLTVVNRLTPSSYPATLQSIRIRFDQFQGMPSPVGQRVRLIAFVDTNATGQPSTSPTLLINQFVTISQITTFVDFNISPITINAGDLYVGYQAPSPANAVGFSLDTNGSQKQRTFASTNNGFDYNLLQFTDGSKANAMIRAVVAYNTVAPGEEELKIDDGSLDGRGILQDNLLMVNRLTPSVYPVKLKSIRVFFPVFQNNPSPLGQTIRIVAFVDPSASGKPPTQPSFLVDRRVTITQVNAFIDFSVDSQTITSGDIYVGYQAPNPANGIGFATDTTGFQQDRSFFSNDNGVTFDGPARFSDGTKMNLMIRAVVAKQNGGTNPDFALIITPNSQTISAGSATSFNINVSAINGFSQAVALSASASPNSGVAVSLSSSLVNPGGNATLTFSTNSTTPKTTYTITVTATAMGLTRLATSAVTVIETSSQTTVTIQATQTTILENSSNSGSFIVSRTGSNSNSLTVNYSVSGTATSGTDYQKLVGSVLFAAGASQATITVTPIDDNTNEGDETVIVTLVNGSGYQIGSPSSATITIIDNEGMPTITISRSLESIPEMSVAEFIVTSNTTVNRDTEISYQVSGSATSEQDYNKLSGKVTIYKGTDQASIPLVAMMDSAVESSETVALTLQPANTYQIGQDSSATITIIDNTKTNGAVVDTKQGAIVVGDDATIAVVAPSSKTGTVAVSINKIKAAPKKVKTNNIVAVVSGTYSFTLNGNTSPDRLVLGIPIAPSLLPAIASKALEAQYQDPTTKAWVSIGDRNYYDTESKTLYFRVELSTTVQTSNNNISVLAAKNPTLAGNYRVVNRILSKGLISENPSSNFKIYYYPPSITEHPPDNSSWNGGSSCSGNTDSKIPNYVLDLDKNLNDIYAAMLNLSSKPFSALTTPQEIYIKACGSNGTEAGESPLGGPMAISNVKISNCQDMKQVAAHELVHVFQGQHYTNGKLGYVVSSIIGNNWFVDAVANYYAIKALKMTDSEIKTFLQLDGGLTDYLSVSLRTDSDNSRYGVAHFLLWLEKEYKTDIVANVLKAENTWDEESISEQLVALGVKDGLREAFDKYGAYLQTHPEDYDSLNSTITGQVWQRLFGEKYLSGSVLSDKVYYNFLSKDLDPLSLAYVEIKGNNTSDAMLVVNFSGSNAGRSHSYTYDFTGSKSTDFAGKTPLETERYIAAQKFLTIKHFGQGQTKNSISQMITNSSRDYFNNQLRIAYYLLVPPVIKTVEDGRVIWTFGGIGNSPGLIPPNLIKGFDIYNKLGEKLNSMAIKSLDPSATQLSYEDSRIKAGDILTVTIVDTSNNSWPEVKIVPPDLQNLDYVYVLADLFFKEKEKDDKTKILPFSIQAAFMLNHTNATITSNGVTAYGVKNGYGNILEEFRLVYNSNYVSDIYIKANLVACSGCTPNNTLIIQGGGFTPKWYGKNVSLGGASTASGVSSKFTLDFTFQGAIYKNSDLIDTLPGYSYGTGVSVSGGMK